ncbi:MAG: hypothetical protein TU36_005165 [Vulcanisaeta sp. AZ3]|jgi:hypothetical protein
MEAITETKGKGCITLNRKLMKALAITQLGLAGVLALFSTIIDPPSIIDISIITATLSIEGTAISIMIKYLRQGCLASSQ